MKSKIVSLIAAAVLLCPNYVFAEHPHAGHKAEQPSTEEVQAPVEVNNANCPVSGESVMAMGGGFKYERAGKVYNLCCPGCVSVFESDPAKYSKIAEEGPKL